MNELNHILFYQDSKKHYTGVIIEKRDSQNQLKIQDLNETHSLGKH
jgi:hypothetical protein